MSHFGVLSYRGAGHLNPLIALSRRLVGRGHRVTFFQHPELEQRVRAHALEFFPLDVPARRSDGQVALGKSRSTGPCLRAFRERLDHIAKEIEGFFRAYPLAIAGTTVDTLIMGEISFTGPTVAEMLGLPYFIVSTSIPHNFGWDDPLSLTPAASRIEHLQSQLLQVSILNMRGPVRRILDGYRSELGLGKTQQIGHTFPELAHITQWPECLDLPRFALPENFFYTGPFIEEASRGPIDFPWHQLDGRPLVYASLGTTLRGDPAIFQRIAEACSRLDLQLVISLGGRRDPASLGCLPDDLIVVANAPQIDLLKRTDIVITHGGPNTVLEALMYGKPMLALPLTLDQPTVSARAARLGVAEALSTRHRSAADIEGSLRKLQHDSSYRNAARALQIQIESLNGLDRAADIIENRMSTREPLPGRRPLHDLSLTAQ